MILILLYLRDGKLSLLKLIFSFIRLKVQPVKVQEMIKPILCAGDVEGKLSINNTNNVLHARSLEQKREDVNFLIFYKNLDDGWGCKVRGRKGQGTGRMKHLKDVPRKFRNGFRTVNNFTAALGDKVTKKTTELKKAKIPKRKLR